MTRKIKITQINWDGLSKDPNETTITVRTRDSEYTYSLTTSAILEQYKDAEDEGTDKEQAIEEIVAAEVETITNTFNSLSWGSWKEASALYEHKRTQKDELALAVGAIVYKIINYSESWNAAHIVNVKLASHRTIEVTCADGHSETAGQIDFDTAIALYDVDRDGTVGKMTHHDAFWDVVNDLADDIKEGSSLEWDGLANEMLRREIAVNLETTLYDRGKELYGD